MEVRAKRNLEYILDSVSPSRATHDAIADRASVHHLIIASHLP
jgi:hypothetical protein